MKALLNFFRKYALPILLIFHAVGFIGISFIDTGLFAALTPFNLLLSSFLLILCHQGDKKPLLVLFSLAVILGYLAELLGTKTGFPFGNYHYGQALGPMLWKVPVIIGVNWFLMLSSSGYAAKKLVKPVWLQVLLAAALMTLTDLAIEPVAPLLGYWYWEAGPAPLMNYAGWLAVSIVMQMLFQKTIARQHNSLGIPYYLTVSVFFVLLNLTL